MRISMISLHVTTLAMVGLFAVFLAGPRLQAGGKSGAGRGLSSAPAGREFS